MYAGTLWKLNIIYGFLSYEEPVGPYQGTGSCVTKTRVPKLWIAVDSLESIHPTVTHCKSLDSVHSFGTLVLVTGLHSCRWIYSGPRIFSQFKRHTVNLDTGGPIRQIYSYIARRVVGSLWTFDSIKLLAPRSWLALNLRPCHQSPTGGYFGLLSTLSWWRPPLKELIDLPFTWGRNVDTYQLPVSEIWFSSYLCS